MADPGASGAVEGIKARMRSRGVDLDQYLERVTNSWESTPRGFGFTCKDDAQWHALLKALTTSSNFGVDTGLGASQHPGVSFREISKPDSAHITMTSRPDSKTGATCSIHVDSVSPVLGRDPGGKAIYDCGTALQHVFTDLLHTPLIVPSSDNGLVLGFRFKWP
jgi:hypothetical protein